MNFLRQISFKQNIGQQDKTILRSSQLINVHTLIEIMQKFFSFLFGALLSFWSQISEKNVQNVA